MMNGDREAYKQQLKDASRAKLLADIRRIQEAELHQGKSQTLLEIIRKLRSDMMCSANRLQEHVSAVASKERIKLDLEAYLEVTDEFLQEAMKGDA